MWSRTTFRGLYSYYQKSHALVKLILMNRETSEYSSFETQIPQGSIEEFPEASIHWYDTHLRSVPRCYSRRSPWLKEFRALRDKVWV